MLAFGESKKEAVAEGTEKDKIFSVNTYKSYWKHIKYFLRFIKQKHPECTTLKGAKKYVNEWLQSRADEELSAWTVQLEAKALGKLYGIAPDDEDYFKPPKRNWEDIKRSRSDCVRDEHFSEAAARRQLEEDLFSEENERLSAAIGITGRYLDDYEKMRAEKHLNPNDPFFQGNIALATLQRLKRNFRSGYWEVSLLHTKPLGDIPEELLPERKKTTRET